MPGAIFDAVAATQITKSFFSPKQVQTFAYMDPFFGLMPKDETCTGANYVGVVGNALMSSTSADPKVAFGGTGSQDQYTKFTMNWSQGYGLVQVDGFVLEQTGKDEGSFVKLIKKSVQNGIKAMGVMIAGQMYGNGSGIIATVTNINGLVCTVAGIGSANSGIRGLSKGATLAGSLTNTIGSLPLSGTVQITAIDYNAQTFTTAIPIATAIPGFVVGSFVGLAGCIGNALPGMQAWVPDANNRPTAGEVFGGLAVGARATDPVSLAGNYVVGSSAPKEETLIQAGALIDQCGGTATHLFCNHLDAADIMKTFQSRGVLPLTEKSPGNPQVGFSGFEIATGMGPLKVYTSAFLAQGSAWMTQLDSWVMPGVNGIPHILEDVDGLTWCRVPGDNAYGLRLGYGLTVFNNEPWSSAAILF